MIPLLLLTWLGCTGEAPKPAEPAGPTRVRLALNWFPEPEFGGFYEGKLSGIYEKAGFDVEILPGGPGAPTLELLSSGQAEAAITMADELLLKRSKGVAAVGAWPAFQLNPMGLIGHTGAGVQRFEDVTGGRIAVEIGGPFQQVVWKKYGWEGKVEMVPTSGSLATFLADPALLQQAYVTAEPCLAKAQGADTVFLKAADAGWNPYGTVLAFADPPPAWAGDFVAATAKAWEAYIADPSRANAELAKLNDQMKPELMGCIVDAQKPFLSGTDGLGAMTQARWDAVNTTMVELGLLPAGSTAAGAWMAPRKSP